MEMWTTIYHFIILYIWNKVLSYSNSFLLCSTLIKTCSYDAICIFNMGWIVLNFR